MSVVIAVVAGTLPRVVLAEEEFRSFYAAEFAALAGYCWSLVSDTEHAHDLAQEAFTRLLARWRHVEEPRAYVYNIATNLARKAWRGRARNADTLAVLAQDRSLAAGLELAPETAFAVRAAVDGLPRRLRQVVLLHYFADLSVADVAAAVRRPSGTVKRQLSEARALLAVALEVSGG
ncbi:MAG TPA: RNA polymerase sigma factor [Mycobacteriales bacterium]|nr:RNA polymerase sigma factor [Mycobacteriales bacterium]